MGTIGRIDRPVWDEAPFGRGVSAQTSQGMATGGVFFILSRATLLHIVKMLRMLIFMYVCVGGGSALYSGILFYILKMSGVFIFKGGRAPLEPPLETAHKKSLTGQAK